MSLLQTPIGGVLRRPLVGRTAMIAALLVGVLSGYVAWQIQPPYLSSFNYWYDEGVYGQTAWAVERGHRLFEDVFASQPPLLTYLTAATYTYTGPSVAAGRTLVVVLSLAALVGVGLMAGRIGGWQSGVCAIGLLALSHSFSFTARRMTPETPALGFGTLAVAFAASYLVDRRPIWWVAAGLAFATATLAKLTALTVLMSLAMLLIVSQRPLDPRKSSAHLGLLLAPVFLAWGVVLVLFDPVQVLDQLVLYHASAKAEFPLDLSLNLGRLRNLVTRDPLPWMLALLGIGRLWSRRQRPILLVCLTWLLTATIALAIHSPLTEHHLVLVLPPVSVLGGVGLAAAVGTARSLVQARAGKCEMLQKTLAVCALGAVVLTLPSNLGLHAHSLRHRGESRINLSTELQAGPERGVPISGAYQFEGTVAANGSADGLRAATTSLRTLAEPESVMVTDDPMVALAAGLPVPPSLVDTSHTRIRSRYLTNQQIQEVLESGHSATVLFWSNRFDDYLPSFRAWARRNLRHERSFGPGQDLYVKRPVGAL